MPAVIKQVRIRFFQHVLQLVYFIFQFITIDHGKILMMVVSMMCHIGMIVDEPVGMHVVFMMDSCVKQDAETSALQRGNGNDRYAKHFRQKVQVDFHAPFFNDIHHVQGHYDRPSQFEKL